MDPLKPGDQIAYIPAHAYGLHHPDTEFGFVARLSVGCAYCRYWRKGHPGELRTKANSEATPFTRLVKYHSVKQEVVEAAMREYCQ